MNKFASAAALAVLLASPCSHADEYYVDGVNLSTPERVALAHVFCQNMRPLTARDQHFCGIVEAIWGAAERATQPQPAPVAAVERSKASGIAGAFLVAAGVWITGFAWLWGYRARRAGRNA